MNARRYPRTMQEAFGPCTNNQLHPMHEDARWTPGRVVLCIAYLVALVAVPMVLR
jgi:hypothetical protein